VTVVIDSDDDDDDDDVGLVVAVAITNWHTSYMTRRTALYTKKDNEPVVETTIRYRLAGALICQVANYFC